LLSYSVCWGPNRPFSASYSNQVSVAEIRGTQQYHCDHSADHSGDHNRLSWIIFKVESREREPGKAFYSHLERKK